MKWLIFYSAIIILLILPGCWQLGKQWKKPALPMPATFSNYSSAVQSANLVDWWKSFNDPILECLIIKAIENNCDLKKTIEKIEELRCIYNIRKAEFLPIINGFGFSLEARLPRDIPIFANLTRNPTGVFGLGLLSNWEIDFFGRISSARNAACADLKAQIETMRDVYIMLLADVSHLYVQARSLEIKINISEQRISYDREILRLLNNLFHAGLLDETPIALQEQQIDDSLNSIANLKELLKISYNNLAVLVGQMPECFSLEPGNGSVPMANNMLQPGLPSELMRRRPDIRRAEQQIIAADERIAEAVADFFPKISLLGIVASVSTLLKTWFDGNSLGWVIGPDFTWPLITFGRITYNVKAKKSIYRQAMHNYCQIVLKAFADVENSLAHYFSQEEQLGHVENKLAASTVDVMLMKKRYKAGLADKAQYYIVKKNRLIVLLQKIDAQGAFTSSLISVYKSLGGGWQYVSNCA